MKNLPKKEDDPSILVFVHVVGDRGTCSAYVIAGGIQIKVNTNLRDAFTHLVISQHLHTMLAEKKQWEAI